MAFGSAESGGCASLMAGQPCCDRQPANPGRVMGRIVGERDGLGGFGTRGENGAGPQYASGVRGAQAGAGWRVIGVDVMMNVRGRLTRQPVCDRR